MNHLKKTFMLLGVGTIVLSLFIGGCKPKQEHASLPTTPLKTPEWVKNANIYEVNIRQYTPEGTFTALIPHLGRLKEMGVDILWLMPVHPIGEVNRKGSLGSYYSVKDYLTVNPEYGNMDRFKELVTVAHDYGMYVIIDWVANHTAWDNPLLTQHPDWYTRDSLGKIVSPFDWSDVADLNYEVPAVNDYMVEALKFWVKNTNIDGFRCDVAGMVPTRFWNRARLALDSIKPVFLLAEAEEPALQDSAFEMGYAWSTHNVMNKIVQGKLTANSLDSIIDSNARRFPDYAFLMQFTSNHDENSWNGTEQERLGEAAKVMAVITATIPGMPLIYSGQESAFNHRLLFFEKDPIEWGDYPLKDFYRSILTLKHNNPALANGIWGGAYTRIATSNDSEVLAFMREKEANRVIVLANLSANKVTINLTSKDANGDYTDYISGVPYTIDTNTRISLGPWEYKIYTKL
ncbi:MAG: hypothetical protein A2X11_05335 [Bacteroidetes bacterium GWE2_42_24]|nr:MAG: hypothetical protein A2X11_05335 [Bacteroidetes bacterium GWE2_42_24]OFY26560.1 MAG: hypothetical protein A2X09_03230 [Bacteroidetes bacterium GWF2_43_11]